MFSKVLSFLKMVIGSAGVLAPVLAAFGVVIPPVAIAILPLMTDLMGHAEDAMPTAGSGAIKKAAVTAGVTGFVNSMAQLSTGGQKETYQKITSEMVSGLIDTVAAVANGIAQKPVFDDSAFEAMKANSTR
jgi:hypothetical protein